MGNWNMTVVGVGCHHNTSRGDTWRDNNDADEQFRNFVDSLKKSGHTIQHASFTYGGGEQVLGAYFGKVPVSQLHEASFIEYLAHEIHESGRAAVERGQVLNKDPQKRPFLEWDELPEEAKEGRRSQARYFSKIHYDGYGLEHSPEKE